MTILNVIDPIMGYILESVIELITTQFKTLTLRNDLLSLSFFYAHVV